ncbi:alcohol dehydrogenase catalytic domain-containing protein [Bacillaceae bacterium Marseille-Q3522]|nr:alcohol dehydrogenase catalytic domain-containing protein [Bacillaceae bacterium Marseille-Q3522]
MKAVQFDYQMPRYLLSKVLGNVIPSVYWNSRLSCLRYHEQMEPELPNEDWIKVKVKYGGICGSDLNLLFLHDSPSTSPYVSFPFTIGHEIVGEIAETGSQIQGLKKGDRVVIDPILSCASRGIETPCPSCQKGKFSQCEAKTEGNISPGLLIGACRDTGGGWSSHIVAHKSQVFKLPPQVNDLNGVMVEPFSCALHGVLRNPPSDSNHILIIGGGVIGICVIAAIRALGISCNITALVKHPFQAELVSNYGADKVILLKKQSYVAELATAFKAEVLKPLFGPEVIQGGADIVFECVGRKQSIHDALRFSKNGAKVVLLGLAGMMDRIDWTTVWLNELDVKGCFAYGTEVFQGKHRRTFAIAIDLMQHGKVDLSPLVTHRFPIEDYQNAIRTASNKKSRDAMKVVFEP